MRRRGEVIRGFRFVGYLFTAIGVLLALDPLTGWAQVPGPSWVSALDGIALLGVGLFVLWLLEAWPFKSR